ncbi:UDP-N-acetylmuramoyl-L-alanine--D-glutamate ligase [Paenibacillus contaminans]|uniref:UDP-N-acetylmuramoylalanine--D-glutamate ligase n=1 Tax=Paenibacillus contaminans TaxID=450362 RepID=A0A329MKG8_9BACL|nr:UDP-N-acetylmuramoyl-L-alanine--D-glutamate ligase [Paenibacillus contaminans]RAV19806.1 UDP-N-acetylmuramoyl-L-alanine--D-glutamate ligase [Paenibacillus contaminans]
MMHPMHYRDKQVVVLGLAKSGVAVAKLFHEQGAAVTVNDKKERDACPEAAELEALGISVVCGGHPLTLIHEGVSLVVKNPGIPYTAEPVARATALGIEIVTEVEVAYHICEAPIIGITGSNGKTTTTTLIGNMLEAAGLAPIVAGNIGRSLCDAAAEATSDNRMVVELSSFQLKGTSAFRPHIACLLNVYQTHLDYHGGMEDYIDSKIKLFANQTAEDVAVVNADNDVCRRLIPDLKARLLPISMSEELECGVYLQENTIVCRTFEGEKVPVLPAGELGIPGRHNVQNALAATAVAYAAGVPFETIAKVLRAFRGVEHRLEFVAGRDGVTYINGSKATNPAATIMDIEAFAQPIVLIAGGLDRGMDYMELLPYFENRIKAVVTIGETREKINRVAALAGLQAVKSVDNANTPADALNEAVRIASGLAESGDVVLLSPACASWDMFASYEERGRIFKQSVHNL